MIKKVGSCAYFLVGSTGVIGQLLLEASRLQFWGMPNAEPLFHVGSREEQILSSYAIECQSGVCRVCVFADSEVDCRYGPGKHGATGHWNKRLQHLNLYESTMGEAWQLIKNPYPVG